MIADIIRFCVCVFGRSVFRMWGIWWSVLSGGRHFWLHLVIYKLNHLTLLITIKIILTINGMKPTATQTVLRHGTQYSFVTILWGILSDLHVNTPIQRNAVAPWCGPVDWKMLIEILRKKSFQRIPRLFVRLVKVFSSPPPLGKPDCRSLRKTARRRGKFERKLLQTTNIGY